MAASITITRDSGWMDGFRAYRVMVDDREFCRIRRGESKTFPVGPGRHTLVCAIDWCSSEPIAFDVGEHEHARFEVSSNLRGLHILAALYYIIVRRSQYLLLRRLP
jgi:hypothetical protein